MTKRTRRLFSVEFKLEAALLILDQYYLVTEAAQAMDVGKSTVDNLNNIDFKKLAGQQKSIQM